MHMRFLVLPTCLTVLGCLAIAFAAPVPEKERPDAPRAEKAVREHLEHFKGEAAQVERLQDRALERALPAYTLFAVWFRQYPVARLVPEGLAEANVFAVAADNKVEVLRNLTSLIAFFQTHLSPATTDEQIKEAARAWLSLSQQLHQDGFYQFTLEEDSLKVMQEQTETVVRGKVTVTRGGNGEIQAALRFAGGRLLAIKEESKLRSGPRPICQATKLLDRDPIVRRMAEQDLRIMGRAARDYLNEQRAQASPELRQAIDRLWQRILDEDRE